MDQERSLTRIESWECRLLPDDFGVAYKHNEDWMAMRGQAEPVVNVKEES